MQVLDRLVIKLKLACKIIDRGQRQDSALLPSEQERFDPGIVKSATHGDTMLDAGRDGIRADPDARSEKSEVEHRQIDRVPAR